MNRIFTLLGSVPVGTVVAFAGDHNKTPSGWVNGDEVSRTQYADLFSVIGVSHGEGNYTTSFNLPDYRGLFLRGVDLGQNIDPDASSRIAISGGHTGDKVGSVQSDEFIAYSSDE